MKILILAANPQNDLKLECEIRDLEEAIEKSRSQQALDLVVELAVRVEDLQPLLLKHQPQIVHFCGQGDGKQGLILESNEGRPQWVSTEALAALFKFAPIASSVTCVLLNACNSQEQAQPILEHINYVIGINQEIQDKAAIAFSTGFYLALGYGHSIEQAHEFGCIAIQIEMGRSSAGSEIERRLEVVDAAKKPIPEHLKPILFVQENLEIPASKPIVSITRTDLLLKIDQSLETGFTEDLDFDIHLKLVKIPKGRFLMGSPESEADRERNESPQHWVGIQSFWMSKYPITQSQWWAVAALPKVKIELNPEPSHFKSNHLPVEQVSWYEAVEFCDRLSQKTQKPYRLPSEAEWEYACRAGTTTPFYFGETLSPDLANHVMRRWRTTEVGSFPPNAFGLYDMHGNVWEWCADHWHENYQDAPIDGSAWLSENDTQQRLLRGGSWYNHAWGCRSAYRFLLNPDDRYGSPGFRVVC